jgi:hypothetical protein
VFEREVVSPPLSFSIYIEREREKRERIDEQERVCTVVVVG